MKPVVLYLGVDYPGYGLCEDPCTSSPWLHFSTLSKEWARQTE